MLAVGAGDPVGLQRLVRGLGDLREAVPGVRPDVVVTKVRRCAVGGDAAAEVRAALQRYAGVEQVVVVPHDPPPATSRSAADARSPRWPRPHRPGRR